MNRISIKWMQGLACAALLLGTACDPDIGPEGPQPEPQIEQERPVGPGSQTLTTNEHAAVVPGFALNVSLSGEDVVLDWDNGGFVGDINVYRSTDPHALLDITAGAPLPPSVDVVPLSDASDYLDSGAASQTSPTPHYYYRVGQVQAGNEGTELSLSTMVVKTTTPVYAGFTKFSLCMLHELDLDPNATLHVSDLYQELGANSIASIWTWDAANQSYVGWFPGGGGVDYPLTYGDVVSVQINPGAAPFRSLVGTVPTTEAMAVSGQPGLNWETVPILYTGPNTASYWVDDAGYWGVGRWNSATQDATWYWGPGYQDFQMEACGSYYVELPDSACLSNDDCGAGQYCYYVEAAACGAVAAGLCMPKPLDCTNAQVGDVCGCDGKTYDNKCKAHEAGASVASEGACEPPPPSCEMVFDFEPGEDAVLNASGDWQPFNATPPSDYPGVGFDSFALGTDGNRAYPYPGWDEEVSHVTLTQITLGASLTFDSWHLDEGGESAYDQKRVVFEGDNGETTVLVDCEAGLDPKAFCSPFTASRPGDLWDSVHIDTSALDGQTGSIRLEYDTLDDCCEFEQGWFIDNVSVGECGGGGAIPEGHSVCPPECLELEMFGELVTNPAPNPAPVACYLEDYGSDGIYELHNINGYASVNWDLGSGQCVSWNAGVMTTASVTQLQAQACADLIEEQSANLGMTCNLDL